MPLYRVAVGLSFLIAGVFLLAGLAMLVWVFFLFQQPDTMPAMIIGIIGISFTAMGGYTIRQTLNASRKVKSYKELKARHPQSPWMWRQDWAEGSVRSTAASAAGVLWLFALLWNLISWPAFLLALNDLLDNKQEPVVWFVAIFPLIGLAFLAFAIHRMMMHRRHGVSVFVLETLPGIIGGEMRGRIETAARLQDATDIVVRLACARVSRSGKNSTTTLLWEESLNIPRGSFTAMPHGTVIPVRFVIPFSCEESSIGRSEPSIHWQLSVKASIPGVDYAADFELPVFKTADSSPTIDALHPATEHAHETGYTGQSQVIRRLSRSGGMEWYFGQALNPGAATVMTILALLWGGLIVVLVAEDGPVFMWIVFGFFQLLLLWAVFQLWLGQSLVVVNAEGLKISTGIFPRTKQVQRDEIDRIEPHISMQAGSRSYYSIHLITKAGKKIHLGQWLRSKRDAEEVCREMMAWLKKW